MKKNLVFFHQTSLIGGASISGYYWLKELSNFFDQIIIVIRSNEGGRVKELFETIPNSLVVEYNSFPMPFYHYSGNSHFILSPFFLKNVITILKNYKAVKGILQKYNPDLVIANSYTLSWISIFANKFSNKICIVRETKIEGLLGFRTNLINNFFLKRFSKVVFISDYDLNLSPLPKKQKRLIRNPYNFRKFNAFETLSKDEYPKITFFGGINRLKGTLFLLKGFKEFLVKGNTAKLVLVGKVNIDYKGVNKFKHFLTPNFWYTKKCLKYISEIEDINSKSIEVLPLKKDVVQYFNDSNIIVFCPKFPHQTRLIFESSAFRIPIILPRYQNFMEFNSEGHTYFYEPNSLSSFYSTLVSAIENNNGSSKKLEEAYNRNLNMHGLGVFSNSINTLINDIF